MPPGRVVPAARGAECRLRLPSSGQGSGATPQQSLRPGLRSGQTPCSTSRVCALQTQLQGTKRHLCDRSPQLQAEVPTHRRAEHQAGLQTPGATQGKAAHPEGTAPGGRACAAAGGPTVVPRPVPGAREWPRAWLRMGSERSCQPQAVVRTRPGPGRAGPLVCPHVLLHTVAVTCRVVL